MKSKLLLVAAASMLLASCSQIPGLSSLIGTSFDSVSSAADSSVDAGVDASSSQEASQGGNDSSSVVPSSSYNEGCGWTAEERAIIDTYFAGYAIPYPANENVSIYWDEDYECISVEADYFVGDMEAYEKLATAAGYDCEYYEDDDLYEGYIQIDDLSYAILQWYDVDDDDDEWFEIDAFIYATEADRETKEWTDEELEIFNDYLAGEVLPFPVDNAYVSVEYYETYGTVSIVADMADGDVESYEALMKAAGYSTTYDESEDTYYGSKVVDENEIDVQWYDMDLSDWGLGAYFMVDAWIGGEGGDDSSIEYPEPTGEWTTEDLALISAHFGEYEIPYPANDNVYLYWDEEYECLSIEADTFANDMEAYAVLAEKAGYECTYYSDDDSYEGYIQIDETTYAVLQWYDVESTDDAWFEIDAFIYEESETEYDPYTFDFSTEDQITSKSSTSVTWTNGDLTFTVDQGKGSLPVGGDGSAYLSDPLRLYVDHTATIYLEEGEFSKVTISCKTEAYATTLSKTTITGGTAKADGTDVIITANAGVNEIKISNITSKIFITGLVAEVAE